MIIMKNLYGEFKYWSPHFWYMMRCHAYNYSSNPSVFDKNTTKRFYLNFQYFLPDLVYRENYKKAIEKFPIEKNICCGKCLINWVDNIYKELMYEPYIVNCDTHDKKKYYRKPEHWGPHYWFVMRMIANNYPDIPTDFQKNITEKFYNSLKYILPCQICRMGLTKIMARHSINNYVSTKEDLIKWVEFVYKEVNGHVSK